MILWFLLPAVPVYPASSGQGQTVHDYRFDHQPGDTLVIDNDYGRVRVQTWDKPEVTISIRIIAADPEQLRNVSTVCSKVGTRIFVTSYFFSFQAESVLIDVQGPPSLNLIANGANTSVDLLGLSGFVRVQSLTGYITARGLTGSVSLFSQEGNVSYSGDRQPAGDTRLESQTGNVDCRIATGLNLRTWMRAGRSLDWNGEVNLQSGFLERQLGVGGPTLLAISSQGNLQVRLGEIKTPVAALFEPQAGPSEAPPGSVAPTRASHRPEPRDPGKRSEDSEGITAASGASPAGDASGTQFPSPSGADVAGGGFALKVNVDWVYLNASVRDRHSGRAVPNLELEDFDVFENGTRQDVSKFDSTEAPFSLLLLLDVSGSTKDYLGMIKKASIEFTNLLKPNDRIAIASFNSRTRLDQNFTNDRNQAANAIGRLRSGGGTAFYDALDRSINRFMEGMEGRKAIVVFTDGVDNQLTGDFSEGSSIAFRDLYRSIEEKDTLIYTIFLDTEDRLSGSRGGTVGGILGGIILGRGGPLGTGNPGVDPRAYDEARHQLEMIADQTGARMYAPRSIQDLAGVFDEIAQDLRVQYTLGYSSSNPAQDGKWRTLEVRVRDRNDVVVRSRKGYYAGRQ